MGRRDVPALTPGRITVTYVVIGLLWVLASDWMLAEVFVSRTLEGTAQTIKSAGFIIGSGVLVFALTHRGHTQLRKRTQTLFESTEEIESLFDVSPHAVIQLDLDGRVQRWNPAAAALFGWEETEVLGEEVPFVGDHDRAEFRTHIDRVADGESIEQKEIVRQQKDGSDVHLDLSAVPVRDASNEVVSIWRSWWTSRTTNAENPCSRSY